MSLSLSMGMEMEMVIETESAVCLCACLPAHIHTRIIPQGMYLMVIFVLAPPTALAQPSRRYFLLFLLLLLFLMLCGVVSNVFSLRSPHVCQCSPRPAPPPHLVACRWTRLATRRWPLTTQHHLS